MMRRGWRFGSLLVAIGMIAGPADGFAHASGRGFVLLLPTGHYIAGGAAAVAASFGALLLLKADTLSSVLLWRRPLVDIPGGLRFATSLISFLLLALLVAAGIFGSRDPLSNPLPLTVWTLFWIGLTFACGLLGNIFAYLDPWYAPGRIVAAVLPSVADGEGVPRPLPVGYWPAVIQFGAFSWFELVSIAPDDPGRLAMALLLFWLANFIAILIFGHRRWTRTCEPFSVFFRVVSRLSVLELVRNRAGNQLQLRLPGAKLLQSDALPLSGIAFVLLALSSVSFDGLLHSFAWLSFNGINPLDFPGRSAMIAPNTLGLIGAAVLFVCLFLLAVWLGERLSGDQLPLRRAAGLLVWSVVPIALAYHAAHYISALIVNGQYALVALSDPFALGWNLFGTAHDHVSAGAVMGAQAAWVVWNFQAGVIVAGHVLAVIAAHLFAARLHPVPAAAMRGQLPLALLMVGYTVFGLWLLSTPTAA